VQTVVLSRHCLTVYMAEAAVVAIGVVIVGHEIARDLLIIARHGSQLTAWRIGYNNVVKL
jgi:hypothetical protein